METQKYCDTIKYNLCKQYICGNDIGYCCNICNKYKCIECMYKYCKIRKTYLTCTKCLFYNLSIAK